MPLFMTDVWYIFESYSQLVVVAHLIALVVYDRCSVQSLLIFRYKNRQISPNKQKNREKKYLKWGKRFIVKKMQS